MFLSKFAFFTQPTKNKKTKKKKKKKKKERLVRPAAMGSPYAFAWSVNEPSTKNKSIYIYMYINIRIITGK
jgi:hypothetical protein